MAAREVDARLVQAALILDGIFCEIFVSNTRNGGVERAAIANLADLTFH